MCSVARKKNLYFFNVDFVMIKQFLLEYTDLQYYSRSACIENAVYLRLKSMHENYVKLYGPKIL